MAVEKLPDFPRLGRMVPEAGYQELIRELIFQGYRVIYRIRSDELLQVVTVLHGARKLECTFRDRPICELPTRPA